MSEAITQSVADVNTKTLGDNPAFYAGLAMGNAVSHQNRMNVLAESAIAAGVKAIGEMDPLQALSLARVGFASSDSTDTLAKLAAIGKATAGV